MAAGAAAVPVQSPVQEFIYLSNLQTKELKKAHTQRDFQILYSRDANLKKLLDQIQSAGDLSPHTKQICHSNYYDQHTKVTNLAYMHLVPDCVDGIQELGIQAPRVDIQAVQSLGDRYILLMAEQQKAIKDATDNPQVPVDLFVLRQKHSQLEKLLAQMRHSPSNWAEFWSGFQQLSDDLKALYTARGENFNVLNAVRDRGDSGSESLGSTLPSDLEDSDQRLTFSEDSKEPEEDPPLPLSPLDRVSSG